MRARLALLLTSLFLLSGLAVVPVQAAATCPAGTPTAIENPTTFNDGCYHQYLLYNPDTPEVDVLILPPATANNAVRDITLIEQSIAAWDAGIEDLGASWFRDGFDLDWYRVGIDAVPNEALWDPELVVVSASYNPVRFGLLGIGQDVPVTACHGISFPITSEEEAQAIPNLHWHPDSLWASARAECGNGGFTCFVINMEALGNTAGQRRNMYDLVSHEFGHCLGIGHVGDATDFTTAAFPAKDIMAYAVGNHVHCVSTMDLRALEHTYAHLLGQVPNRNTAGQYMRSHPSNWDDVNCAEPTVGMTDTTPLGEADPLGEPKDDDGTSSEDPGEPLVAITQPGDGAAVDPGQAFTVAGTVDRDGSTSTSTSTSTTTTTSSTSTSAGPGPACANDGANGLLGLAPAAPPTHDLTRVCMATSGDNLVLTASLADMRVDSVLACNESGVSYGFWLNDAASPIEVMCFLGASVANWELEDSFGTAATAEFDYAANTVTVTVPLAELASVALEAPFTVYAETYNGPGAYGGRPMWLTGTLAGFGLYVDRVPDEGAVAASGRTVGVDGATRLPLAPSPAAALGQSGEQSLYFTRGTVGVGNADTAFGGSRMAPERPTGIDPAVVVTQNQFGGTNVRTIYDATWQYDGEVDLDGATIDVTWHASSVTGAGSNVLWDVSAYVYTGDTAPAPDAATATVQVLQALTPTPGEHKATLTGATGQGDHLAILIRPAFALADNMATAAAIFYDGADYPSGITVLGDVQPPAAERVEVHEGASLLATSNDLATTGLTSPAAWTTQVTLTGDGPHTLTATWMEADGTVLDTAQVTVDVAVTDPCAGVTAGPVLSGIAWSAGEDVATITWSTDVAASSVVNYGTSPSYGQYASTPGMTTSHSVTLTGLERATTYHYQVVSASCGYASESVDNTFTTTGQSATVEVTSPAASSIVQAPVSFAGRFDLGDAGQTRTGTGLVTAQAGSAQWAFTVQGILASPEWQQLVERLEGLKGFRGAVPNLEGGATVYLAGKLPKGAPLQAAGFTLGYEVKAKPQTLRAPVLPSDLAGAQRLSVEDAVQDWQARMAEPGGPALPGLPEGIGPGTAMLQGVNGVQFLCSVSYLFQDPSDPKQYYISTAGHCLLATGQGLDRTGEANPGQVNNHFELCYADCIDNALGVGSYVVLERTATYEPVAYASAAPVGAADAEGIGRDFGLLRVPKELNGMLRPWLAQWGGPDRLDSAGLGDLVVHYGHGTYCCPVTGGLSSRTPADQGRVGVAWGSFADGSYETVGWITGGDSGSASGLGAIDAEKGVRGSSALGVNTHGMVTGVGLFEGTLLSKGQTMVNAKLGFVPRLVLADEEIGAGGGGGTDPAISFTSPDESSSLDASQGAATLTGTATFPDGAGSGTQAPLAYYLHRPGCGDAADVTAMDLVPASEAEAGHGCGNLGGTRMSQSWPATQDPATPIPAGSTVVAHVRAFGLRPHPRVVMTGTLTANGALVGSGDSPPTDVIALALVATPCTQFTMTFTTTASIAADADLTFAASTQQGTQDLPVCYEGGTEASRVVITPLAPPQNSVQVSVDDATFGAASLLPVAGSASWSATWDLAGVAAGEHTLRARLVQDGVPSGPVATRHVTVEGTSGESGLRTQLQLRGPDGPAFDWTTVGAHTGQRTGSWSHAWAPGDAASGNYTLLARLLDNDTVLATHAIGFVIDTAPEFALSATASLSEGEAFVLPLQASDADGDALTYSVRRVDAPEMPAGATLDGDRLVWTPGFEDAGTYALAFTVSDGYLQDTAVVNFTVANVNRAPQLADLADQRVAARDTLTFQVTGTDPDGDDLALFAQDLPEGATFDAGTGTFTWTPSHKDAAGKDERVYEVSFTASDGQLDASGTVAITVTKK